MMKFAWYNLHFRTD